MRKSESPTGPSSPLFLKGRGGETSQRIWPRGGRQETIYTKTDNPFLATFYLGQFFYSPKHCDIYFCSFRTATMNVLEQPTKCIVLIFFLLVSDWSRSTNVWLICVGRVICVWLIGKFEVMMRTKSFFLDRIITPNHLQTHQWVIQKLFNIWKWVIHLLISTNQRRAFYWCHLRKNIKTMQCIFHWFFTEL